MNHSLGQPFESVILAATEATSMSVETVIQELWSGYGQILRIALTGGRQNTVIVKHVTMPEGKTHPRGWNSNLSHERKVFSYQVETSWYQTWASRCDEACRIPGFLSFSRHEADVLLVLEDLDAAGYPSRLDRVHRSHIGLCLEWLAEFHATYMAETPTGLWKTGTYWHLETRPDELDKLADQQLKAAAPRIDRELNAARFQTFVHGDAKLANFCFSAGGDKVAAVDFQYVGGGCGMKDVAYFIGSCLDERAIQSQEKSLLDCYFTCLKQALNHRQPKIDTNAVEAEWRKLFPLAWTDFHRFLKGWCPGHWKINTYSERVANEVIRDLGK
ncbi:MAG: phosphotransferase [Verrucomicrobiia bacterium]|jgi:hypothetical protein